MLLVGLLTLMQTMGWLFPNPDEYGYYYGGDEPLWLRLLNVSPVLTYLLAPLLTAIGLGAGIRTLNKGRSWRRTASVGAILAASSPLVLACVIAYSASSPYYAGEPVIVVLWHVLAWPLGLVLLGLAAMRVRGLRAWRFLPLGLGFAALLATVPQVPLLLVEPGYTGYESETMQALEELALLWYLLPIPLCLGSLLLVRPLLWAPRREQALVEAENLALARRLYHGAWVGDDPAVVDELTAPDLADHYGGGCGPESLKRSIAGLRKSFADLRFVVEGQEAEGDRVTTRWTASGTDGGGMLWYPPTGRSAEFRGSFVDRFEGGKLVEHTGARRTRRGY